MRRKKLLSTVVASAIAAAQMAMPVMAADGGSVEVDVTTKAAVIRVEVPTTMSIAVDQFMIGDAGTQISSDAFTMVNKSAVDVKVTVTSTADLGASTTLVATKAGAAESTTAGEAWMGVAAQSASGDYDDPTTDTSTTDEDGNSVADVPETIATLTEANANVATFVQGTDANAAKGTATQEFYLAKATDAVTYKMLNANESAEDISYAQFYELTVAAVADDDALSALVKTNRVFKAAAAAADGQALTLVAEGDAKDTTAGVVYYTAADSTTAKDDLNAAKLYVYGGAGTADANGSAAFRYIGALSPEQEVWTKDDISKITIAYDIVGLTADRYAEVKDDCTYGVYYEAADPVVMDTTGLITLLVDAADIQSLVVNDGSEDYEMMNTARGTWEVWDEDNALQKFQLGSAWTDYLKGKSAKAIVTLQDGTELESDVVSFPE